MASFDILSSYYKVDKKDPRAWLYNLILGGTSGTIAVTLTYPTDLIRRRMQLVGMEGQHKYNGMFDCGIKIYQHEGFVGLWKGLVPCYVKVVPAMAIMFWCNEKLKRLFNVHE